MNVISGVEEPACQKPGQAPSEFLVLALLMLAVLCNAQCCALQHPAQPLAQVTCSCDETHASPKPTYCPILRSNEGPS